MEVTETISSSEKVKQRRFPPSSFGRRLTDRTTARPTVIFILFFSICVSHAICEVAVLKWREDTETSILEMTPMLPIPIPPCSYLFLPHSLTSENPPTLLRFVFSKLSYLFPHNEVLTAAPRPRPRRCRRRNHSPRRTPPQRGRACGVFPEGIRGRCLAHFFPSHLFFCIPIPSNIDLHE